MKHQTSPDSQGSAIEQALKIVNEERAAGNNSTLYIYSGYTWLLTGVWVAIEPPMWSDWFIACIPGRPPMFVYGNDSQQHVQVGEYLKWIRHMIDTGAIQW